ncbi:polymer-forming cytoskeletal protein [Elizabethkingia sp. HX QKY]|uniref:bactofilin family protein n=1 Tax=Elizabethkingia TaxID=308865 RepID=UPI002A23D690|nr:polymer-forming cytoskeletal protein [Elizabethkingia sp. HX QKY]MDX8571553.1 polymer-forming cytoskeletal protein [Elizabethkingia sp. HX QKY]
MFKKEVPKIQPTNLNQQAISTVIASEIEITGDIKGTNTIRIDGKVTGNITIDSGIILGENAYVDGSLNSKTIIIYGTLKGNLTCDELQLRSTGKVEGDLNVKSLEVEIGGKYNGKVNMSANHKIIESNLEKV